MKTHFADDETLAHIQKLERDNKELREALEATIAPLDLYNAYGWPDRMKVRNKIRAILEKTK